MVHTGRHGALRGCLIIECPSPVMHLCAWAVHFSVFVIYLLLSLTMLFRRMCMLYMELTTYCWVYHTSNTTWL
jgi:hypothetical protein